MSNCEITQGFTLGCFGASGIEKAYVATYEAGASWELDADDQISGATMTNQFYELEMDAEYAGVEQTITGSRENASTFFETNVSLKFANLDKELIKLVKTMAKAPMTLVLKSNSGEWFVAGVESAGRTLEGTLSAGVLLGDLNGSTLVVNYRSANGIYSIDPTVAETLVTPTP